MSSFTGYSTRLVCSSRPARRQSRPNEESGTGTKEPDTPEPLNRNPYVRLDVRCERLHHRMPRFERRENAVCVHRCAREHFVTHRRRKRVEDRRTARRDRPGCVKSLLTLFGARLRPRHQPLWLPENERQSINVLNTELPPPVERGIKVFVEPYFRLAGGPGQDGVGNP